MSFPINHCIGNVSLDTSHPKIKYHNDFFLKWSDINKHIIIKKRSGHDLLSLLASFGLSAGRTSRDSISCQLFALISPIFNLSFTQSPYFLGFLVDVSQPQKLYLQNVTFSCQSSFLNAFKWQSRRKFSENF